MDVHGVSLVAAAYIPDVRVEGKMVRPFAGMTRIRFKGSPRLSRPLGEDLAGVFKLLTQELPSERR